MPVPTVQVPQVPDVPVPTVPAGGRSRRFERLHGLRWRLVRRFRGRQFLGRFRGLVRRVRGFGWRLVGRRWLRDGRRLGRQLGRGGTSGGGTTGGESSAGAGGSANTRSSTRSRITDSASAACHGAAQRRECVLRETVARSSACLDDLSSAQRRVLMLRAGAGAGPPRSRGGVAKKLRISERRVARLERTGLSRRARSARQGACETQQTGTGDGRDVTPPAASAIASPTLGGKDPRAEPAGPAAVDGRRLRRRRRACAGTEPLSVRSRRRRRRGHLGDEPGGLGRPDDPAAAGHLRARDRGGQHAAAPPRHADGGRRPAAAAPVVESRGGARRWTVPAGAPTRRRPARTRTGGPPRPGASTESNCMQNRAVASCASR